MTQNLWDGAKAVLIGKLKAIQSYLKKEETSQIKNLTIHLKQLEKEEQKPQKEKINETELFFKKINKIDKPLVRLIKNIFANNMSDKGLLSKT